MRTSGFHQVLVVNGDARSQKDEGDYFPEWLRELVVALVRPVPVSATVLRQGLSKGAIREHPMTVDDGYRDTLQTDVDWDIHLQDATHAKSSNSIVLRSENAFVASSRLSYASGAGWSGVFDSPKNFHGAPIARQVSILNPRTNATVKVLEDLNVASSAALFASLPDISPDPIETAVVSDEEFHEHMQPTAPAVMPAVKTPGPSEVTLWVDIATDRAGQIRLATGPLADMRTPSVQAYFNGLKITPFERNGHAVQAVGRVYITFAIPREPLPK